MIPSEKDAYRAIERSKRRTEIVTIPYSETSAHVLLHECTGSVDANETEEFWGEDIRGCEWRVHLRRYMEAP